MHPAGTLTAVCHSFSTWCRAWSCRAPELMGGSRHQPGARRLALMPGQGMRQESSDKPGGFQAQGANTSHGAKCGQGELRGGSTTASNTAHQPGNRSTLWICSRDRCLGSMPGFITGIFLSTPVGNCFQEFFNLKVSCIWERGTGCLTHNDSGSNMEKLL